MNRIVICAAMPMEMRSLCRRLAIAPLTPKRTVAQAASLFGETEIILIASGVGRQRMQAQLALFEDAPTSCWISIGAAGGLHSDIQVGACLQGTDVVMDDGQVMRFEPLCEGGTCPLLYCSDQPQSKAECHQRLGAALVDMESAAVARHAKSRGECFAWIKVISDGAEEAIPAEALQCIGQDGFPNIGVSLRVLARKPWALASLIRLGARTSKLDSILADAVFDFIHQFEYKGGCQA